MRTGADRQPVTVQRGEPDPRLQAEAVQLAARAPLPAVDGNVQCGTASWTDKTLVRSGRFYPRGTSQSSARLGFYAQHFNTVEVDASYYALLPESTARQWVAATSDSFRFSVKAFSSLTGHGVELARLPKDIREVLAAVGHKARVAARDVPQELREEIERRFLVMLGPLMRAGKLSAVLCQYPPWFTATRGAAAQLEALRQRHPTLPLAVEFRHPSWMHVERRQRVFELLQRLEMTYVAVDEPAGEVGGVPATFGVTRSALAMVRMHGRNVAGWSRGTSVYQKFDYLYSRKELSQWLVPVRRMSEHAESVHVLFNNCVRDYAVLGAKGFATLLTDA